MSDDRLSFGTPTEFRVAADLVRHVVDDAEMKWSMSGLTYRELAVELECSASHIYNVFHHGREPRQALIARMLDWLSS